MSGAIYATGDIIALSDASEKENITTIKNALHLVSRMRGVNYVRKDTGESKVGVIAQEMKEVLPQVVSDFEGSIGVTYGNIVGVLIEAIKEQQKQLDELKNNIDNST